VAEIVDLDARDGDIVERLASITHEAFRENSPDWVPTIDLARDQVLQAAGHGRLGRVLMVQGEPAGWIGLITGRYVWEIHPLVVAIEHQSQGFGHLLVDDVAEIAREGGGLTLFAGTSDEVGTTSLFGTDIYTDPVGAIRDLEVTGRNPVRFWRSAGFKIVGLMPDAEGIGKPSIYLARRL
jgi:aminoglycoside 6'-N-acetyltransferase I